MSTKDTEQRAARRTAILALLDSCEYVIEVREYRARTNEHFFFASWKSPNRAFCGICGRADAKCGHDDGGLHSQAFVSNLREWTQGKNCKELK